MGCCESNSRDVQASIIKPNKTTPISKLNNDKDYLKELYEKGELKDMQALKDIVFQQHTTMADLAKSTGKEKHQKSVQRYIQKSTINIEQGIEQDDD